jgi:adenosine deaminase
VAAPAAGFSRVQIRTLQSNALIAAFLSPEEKAALLTKKSSISD